jgi:polysaccharide deacetylase family protein (PEP-CTERM system associated)
MVDAFTVDVEDYFHVEAFARDVSRDDWPSFPSRVVRNTMRLLDLTSSYGVRGTFFVLGWVAQRFPELVREIRDRGHEIGCHSYWHRMIYTLSPIEFDEDTRRAKDAIETAAGVAVTGYRAPTFSVTKRSLWALDVLANAGFTFDSSIFPIHHDRYGIVGSPRDPYAIRLRSQHCLTEFPISTFRAFGRDLPVAGGGYLRMLPMWYNAHGIERVHGDRRPVMVYVHPWEIDPDQPRIKTRAVSRLRHYTNLRGMEGRLRSLFERYRFAPVSEVLAARSLPVYQLDEESAQLRSSAAV